jgi:hypothetical protein
VPRADQKRWLPGDPVFFLALLIPVLQWLPLKAVAPDKVLDYTAMTLWTITGLLTLAAWVAKEDLWLGLLMVWFDVQMLRWQTAEVYEAAVMLTLGAVALASVRLFDARRRRIARTALLAMAGFQAVLAIVEFVWFWYADLPLSPFGTIGNANILGLYLAVLAPLAPLWLIPVLLLGILVSASLTGVLAVSVGLLVRFRMKAVPWLAACGAIGAAVFALKGNGFGGLGARWGVWGLTWRHFSGWDWIWGYGPGRWKVLFPAWQIQENFAPDGRWSVFAQLHNDWLLLLVEGGLVALACALLWVWAHRAMFAGEYGGSVAALAVGALGLFPFHLIRMGLPCLVILALATTDKERGLSANHPLNKEPSNHANQN